jgi:pyruvate/2-oxoglutarate dehydrogenase complex dihydrolipoamide dehydrogenase (E3) component
VRTGPVSVDLAAARERKRSMVAGARQNYASRLAQNGLELIEGEAHFRGPKSVEIALADGGARQISERVIVIDTGSRPKPLEIPGASDVSVLYSTSTMELEGPPEPLIILGGGYFWPKASTPYSLHSMLSGAALRVQLRTRQCLCAAMPPAT